MNQQIANKIDIVRNSFPSIFSKDDVLRLLEDLSNEIPSEQQHKTADANSELLIHFLNDNNIKKLSKYIYESLDSSGKDIIDDYELSLSGNEIYVESVSCNEYEIKSCIECAISDFKESIQEDITE